MLKRRTHIIGAGIAGLSAALSATAQGEEAILYEAAPQAGGRCRTLYPPNGFNHDNGTHVLLSANHRALAFLKVIGARGRWIEPEPAGLPLYDATTGAIRRVGLSPWSWLRPSRRPKGLRLSDIGCLWRLAFPKEECSVASIVGERAIMESLISPLTLAVLNTPPADASVLRLSQALRRLLRPGGGKLLVARQGLTDDFIAPALHALSHRGVPVMTSQRLRKVIINSTRAIGLVLADRTVALGPEDRVILALPPYEVKHLLPMLPVPRIFEPILNVHYRVPGPPEPRFLGFTGTLAQWALARSTHVSVTVSAARALIDHDTSRLVEHIWREIAPALPHMGVDASLAHIPEARVVKEQRATIRQVAMALPQPPIRPLANLALAGDWLSSLPASIESAVIAGEEAVRALADSHAYSAARGPLQHSEDAA